MPHFAVYSEGIAPDGPAILKDGHTMFPQDIVKDLNRKSFLESERANASTGSDTALAVIEFMLSGECESPIEFLRCWNEGDFDTIREEWPEAPDSIFIGAEVTSPCQDEQ